MPSYLPILLLLCLGSAPAVAQELFAAPEFDSLVPQDNLPGDWQIKRQSFADKGLEFSLLATQFYQRVAAGGRQQDGEYGGKLDYLANLDAQKAGLSPGLTVQLHAETRLGTSVNNADGLLAPANIAMNFPDPTQDVTALTGLKINQDIGDQFVVYAGKVNTLDESPMRDNGVPGLGGFMNTSLVYNPITSRTIAYSTIGVGGGIRLPGESLFSITAFDPLERATGGLQDPYATGVVISPDLVLQVKPLGRPGVYNFGGTYSTARYTSVDPESYLNLPIEPGAFPVETGSWSLYTNFYQSLCVDPRNEQRHWGLFGQFGISDGNPNPVQFVAIGGIGGRVPVSSRPDDRFGLGLFYLGLSSNFINLSSSVIPQRDEFGMELFYNYAITPSCLLTADLQVARPSTVAFDSAVIPGLRLQLRF